MVRPRSYVTALALLVVACGGGESDGGTDGGSAADAAQAQCAPLELGHCIDGATGEPCLDFEAADRQFVPLTGGETVQPIVGPQGSDMFVFAVRAPGIDPGTDENPPLVQLTCYDGELEQGGYQAWPLFFADGDKMVAPQLYTVIFNAAGFQGQTLRLVAEVVDPSDNRFCGEVSFVVGELLLGAGGGH